MNFFYPDKGVFTEISLIYKELEKVKWQCEHDSVSIAFLSRTTIDTNEKNLDQLDCSFMYTQIIKDIFLTINFEDEHFQKYISFCNEQFLHNDTEVKKVKKFETFAKNIIKETLKTIDKNGNEVIRGNRGYKKKLRKTPFKIHL